MATEIDKEQSPLIKAILENDKDAIISLVEQGADVNAKDDDGNTALMLAVDEQNNGDIVKCLVEHGADINAKNDDGETALIWAALDSGNENVVKYLVEKGADVNIKGEEGQTPLMCAALRSNNGNVVKYLVEHGADVNAKSGRGNTALIYAVGRKNNEDAVKCLVEHGADINARDDDGNTALMLAVEKNNGDIVKYLVEHGADVNAKDEDGYTAFMRAVESNEDIVKYLVEHGADINAKSNEGHTALMVAAALNKKDIFEYLVEHGADLKAKDNEGMGITKYYSKELAREYRKQQRKAYAGDAWKDIQKHTTTSIYDEDETHLGYTMESGDISVGILKRRKPDELMGRKLPDGKNVDGNLYPLSNSFEQMMTFVHEGNHRLHSILDGMYDGNFTAEQNVKVDYCTEAVAHTSECLAAALQYQHMKEAGVEIYQYQDSEGDVQYIPLEELLDRYSPELRKYVTKNGFDPDNKKDVEAVTEIGLQYWEKCKKLYAKNGGQFDRAAVSQGTGEGVSQKEFDALINRMCDGVVIGDGVELDLRRFANRFNGMTDEEAQEHVARANGNVAQETEKSVENSDKGVLRDEMRGQTGERVVLEPADKAKQMRFDMRVDNRNLGQENAANGKGAVEPAKKQERPLDLTIMNANRERD